MHTIWCALCNVREKFEHAPTPRQLRTEAVLQPRTQFSVGVSVQVGIAATEMTARPKDIRGTTFPVEFEITDTLETAHEAAARAAKAAGGNVAMVEDKRLGAPYAVKILLQVRCRKERLTQRNGLRRGIICCYVQE